MTPARKLALAFGLGAAFLLLALPGAAATGPSAPVNLQAVGVTETSVTLAWGPSQPGAFTFNGATDNSVTVGWGASEDTRGGVVRYGVSINGAPEKSVSTNEYRYNGTKRTNIFRLCVRAFNAAGQASALTCGSMTRQ